MLNGNLVGLGMFVIAAVVVSIGSLVLKLPDTPVMIAAGLTVILLDLGLRLRSISQKGWLTNSQHGGYLVFAPAWVFGVIVIVANVIKLAATGK